MPQSAGNIFSLANGPLSLGFLVLPDTNMMSLAAAVDPLRAANRLAQRAHFNWQFLTPRGDPVRLTSGVAIDGPAPAQAGLLDALVVVAGFNLDAQATPDLLGGIRQLAARVSGLGGVDGGPWLLARAGLLDGQTATTHWEDLEGFAARFPAIDVVADRYALSGRVFTTGGAAPCLDLMLHLIRARHGPDLAARVAAALIYDTERPGGAQQARLAAGLPDRVAPQVAQAVRLMDALIETPPPVAAIARRVGLSVRRLEGLFARDLGRTPGRYFLDMRLDEAHRLVSETTMPVGEIAQRTGFASQSSLTRAFSARFGKAPRDARGQGRG